MIEPPVVGFTGVIWESRPAEKLAHDLTTGPGVRATADAAAAWGRIAAAFGTAVVDYDRIIARMREAWGSTESGPVIDRFATLRHWLVDVAAEAGRNASLAAGHAVAYEVAALAMPHTADLAALAETLRGLEQAGAALGAPLVAAVADVDAEQHLAKADAARVMQGYEAAATELAVPPQQPQPPTIVSDTALAAERQAAQRESAPAARGGVPALAGGRFAVPSVPRAMSPYQIRSVAPSAVAAAEPAPLQSSPAGAQSDAGRMVPGGMPAGAGAGGGDRAIRAGAAESVGGDEMQLEAGIQVAPAVLGGHEPRSVPEAGTS
ncbi:PPE domain-containing protein [Nocardia sp. NPDC019395]|uniref:PPE domain-containing protein n=1 Tax=Nocardia sp. NPDC019395 TaxID=3154686 RepID=UPI0033FF612F